MATALNHRMLSREEEIPDSVTVTRVDQDRINLFSTLHQKRGLLEDELSKKAEEKEYLSEVAMELELEDDDELVPYKIGDSFFHLRCEEVKELLEKQEASVGEDIEKLKERVEEIEKTMGELKVTLYAKFGKAINLEV